MDHIRTLRLIIPLFFMAIILIYWTIRDGVLPPIGENLYIFVLLGLGIRLISEPIPKRWNLFLIIVLVITALIGALFYIRIFTIQSNATLDNLKAVINKTKISNVNKEDLVNIGKVLIEPDFIENSITNKISDLERHKRRIFFANLLTNISGFSVKAEDFLVPNRSKHWTVTVHKILVGISYFLLLMFMILNFKLPFPNNEA